MALSLLRSTLSRRLVGFGLERTLTRSVCPARLAKRYICSTTAVSSNQPKSGNEIPRFSGVSTMLRLPLQDNQPKGLDVCFVGVPMDHGCSNRSGTRTGPRAIRQESSQIRPIHLGGAAPFSTMNVADIGDIPVNPFSIEKTMDIIHDHYRTILEAECIPLTLGGDHTLTLGVLRALKEKYGAVGLIQIDAHHDLGFTMLGEKIAHGTPFRRALEEDLISPKHFVQIGLRGSTYLEQDFHDVFEWAQNLGVRQVFIEECWFKSLKPLMESVREQMGALPVYLTFDIDGIDPTYCPGTGTPEVAGLTPIQAFEIVRGCRGLNLIGGDVVEVNPLYDQSGTTAVMAANLLFEMLCALPGVKNVRH